MNRAEAQKQFYVQRSSELRSELERGIIDEEQFKALDAELKRQLVFESEHANDSVGSAPSRASAIKPLWVLAPTLLLAAVLYWHLGAWADLRLNNAQAAWFGSQTQPPTLFADYLRAAETSAARNPDSGDHQLLLGRLYMENKQPERAAEVFSALADRFPQSPHIIAQAAQARYMANGQKLTPELKAQLLRAVELNPHEPTALGLLGVDAFTRRDYAEVIKYWSRLLAQVPPMSSQYGLINDGIERAREALRVDEGEEAVAEASIDEAAITVPVTVDIDPYQRGAGGVLYVFAQANDGNRMPVAVARLTEFGTQVNVMLSNANAMMPQRRISEFDELVFRARLSRSGDVAPKPGDLQALSELIPRSEWEKGIKLTLDQPIQ